MFFLKGFQLFGRDSDSGRGSGGKREALAGGGGVEREVRTGGSAAQAGKGEAEQEIRNVCNGRDSVSDLINRNHKYLCGKNAA